MKKKIALLLAGMLVISSLSGCGNQENNSADTAVETPADTAEADETEPVQNEAEVSQIETESQDEAAASASDSEEDSGILRIAEQGIFSAGGTVVTTEGTFDPVNGQYDPTGQTNYADHANVLYQIPADFNGHNMVFLHGYGQSRMGWMTTPDGRAGWSDMFLRDGYGVYLVDQPRRGEAGQTTVGATIDTTTQNQAWFTQFRLGRWPEFNEGSQFPQDEASIEQFFRQMTPDTGDFDQQVIADALIAVFEQSGSGILVSHSQGGLPAWDIAARSDNVEAHIAIEPGGFVFPESLDTEKYGQVMGGIMSDEDFAKMIEKPIIVYYGDYIPQNGEMSDLGAENFWAFGLIGARTFEQVVNDMGGDCTVVYLPDEGITGNSHFMFQELNNQEIADHIYAWLESKGLN